MGIFVNCRTRQIRPQSPRWKLGKSVRKGNEKKRQRRLRISWNRKLPCVRILKHVTKISRFVKIPKLSGNSFGKTKINICDVMVLGNPHENAPTTDPYRTLFVGRIVSLNLIMRHATCIFYIWLKLFQYFVKTWYCFQNYDTSETKLRREMETYGAIKKVCIRKLIYFLYPCRRQYFSCRSKTRHKYKIRCKLQVNDQVFIYEITSLPDRNGVQ